MSASDQHRVKQGQEELLLVELVRPREAAVRGELVAVRGTGATVRFLMNGLAGIALHQEVVLQFANPRFARPITLRARPSARRDDGVFSTYELWFDEPRVAEIELLPHLKSIFNERRAARAKPDPKTPVAVTLACELGGAKICGRLIEISTRGLSLRIPASDEARIARAWRVQAGLRLPGAVAAPLSIEAQIRQRRSCGKEVELGLEFEQAQDAEFRGRQETVAAYVLSRQQAQTPRPASVGRQPAA